MEIPGLGPCKYDNSLEWYRSEKLPVPVLGGKQCHFVVAGYDDDENKADYHAAIANFLSIDPSVLKKAEPHLYRYYESVLAYLDEDEVETIDSPSDVWNHIELGDEALVGRRTEGDLGIYISLECGCDWEEEHGLQIVFKNGERVNKVGPYDGHFAHSDSFDDESLEDVIFPIDQ